MKELVLINENKHCTYQHRLIEDDRIICIGHGTKARAKSGIGRNKAWKAITKDKQRYWMIIKDAISKDHAGEIA